MLVFFCDSCHVVLQVFSTHEETASFIIKLSWTYFTFPLLHFARLYFASFLCPDVSGMNWTCDARSENADKEAKNVRQAIE